VGPVRVSGELVEQFDQLGRGMPGGGGVRDGGDDRFSLLGQVGAFSRAVFW
jgi:hypothetical protein